MASPVYAFFDVDDTLISIKSMISFQDYWFVAHPDADAQRRYVDEIRKLILTDAPWELLNRRYYAHFAGRSVADVAACAQAWFQHVEQTTPQLFHPAVVAKLRWHQEQGHQPVFVSGSFPALLTPVAERLGVNHMLAIQLVTAEGRYTGDLLPPQTIGEGKAQAVREWLAKTGATAAACYAYGDDLSDAPMLAEVGHPVAVRGGRGLEAHALTRGWRVMSPDADALAA